MSADTPSLLPRASILDVLRGRAAWIGSRCDAAARRGVVSPIEARVHLGIVYEDIASAERAWLRSTHSLWERFGVLARSGLTSWIRGAARRGSRRVAVAGTVVDNLTIADAVHEALQFSEHRARFIHFVHPHAINLAWKDATLQKQLASADVVLPDGVGLRMGARLLGTPLRHNVNGTDLLPLLCRAAAAKGISLALVGGGPGVAEDCANRLSRDYGVSIALTSHGYLDERESERVVERLSTGSPTIVLVGMGSPRQERWAWRYLVGVRGVNVLTVGGLFDFYSGRIPRAPDAIRELGLEWAYRMLQEPKRLGLRYLVGNPLFIARVLAQRLGVSHTRTSRELPSPPDPNDPTATTAERASRRG